VSQQLEASAENAPAQTTEAELSVSGMTCGSCAARVEKVLDRQAGVERAGVNFSTERATVVFDPDQVGVEDLVSAVGKIGYGLAPAEPAGGAEEADAEAELQRMWLRRVLLAWPLGLVVLVLSLFFMYEPWARWSALTLTTPVQFWAGWPFLHQAALRARARQANMDTLIAMGTLAAFAFSAYQVVIGPSHADHYFDTSALIIAFLLLGRYFEARARAGLRAPSASSWSWAPSRPASSPTARSAWCPWSRCRSAISSGSAPARRSPWTPRWSTAAPLWTSPC